MMRPVLPQRSRCRGRGPIPRTLLFVALASLAAAQVRQNLATADTIIRAKKSRPIVHNGNDEPQVFDPVGWQLICPREPFGATAQWSCGPFVHTADATLEVDGRMEIRVRQSTPRADWTVVVPVDETDVQQGDDQALVVASSRGPGEGQIEMIVTFVNYNASVLAPGDYELTVVGTMTAN